MGSLLGATVLRGLCDPFLALWPLDQERAAMARCGEACGTVRVWPSRSSPRGMSSPGSEREREREVFKDLL